MSMGGGGSFGGYGSSGTYRQPMSPYGRSSFGMGMGNSPMLDNNGFAMAKQMPGMGMQQPNMGRMYGPRMMGNSFRPGLMGTAPPPIGTQPPPPIGGPPPPVTPTPAPYVPPTPTPYIPPTPQPTPQPAPQQPQQPQPGAWGQGGPYSGGSNLMHYNSAIFLDPRAGASKPTDTSLGWNPAMGIWEAWK